MVYIYICVKSVPSPVVHGRINCLSAGTPMCSKVEKRRWEAHGFAAPGGASATSLVAEPHQGAHADGR